MNYTLYNSNGKYYLYSNGIETQISYSEYQRLIEIKNKK